MYRHLVASFPVVVEELVRCIVAWVVEMSSNLVVIVPMLKLAEKLPQKRIPVLDLGSILRIDCEICVFRLSLLEVGLRRVEASLVFWRCFQDLHLLVFCCLSRHGNFLD